MPAYNPRSPEAAAYQRWYWTPEWRAMRRAQLTKEPYCRACLASGRETMANTADHIIPHRGDRLLFWDPPNLQSLCTIHDGDKQRLENGGKARTPIGPDGWPLARGVGV